jgi:Gram-negative bacterial TonB protein C-terminal
MGFVVAFLFLFTAAPVVAENPVWSELKQHVKATAGDGALDCGAVFPKETGIAASTCVVDAFRQSKPFYVGYFLNGIDSIVGYALAGDDAGRVFEFRFDFGLPIEPKPHRSIESQQCAEPAELVMSRTGRLMCENGEFGGDVGLCGPVPLHTPVSSSALYKGTIEAEILIHREGSAAVLSVVKSDVSSQATDAALADIQGWRFAPALKDGYPVSVKVSVTLTSDGTTETVAFRKFDAALCLDSGTHIARPSERARIVSGAKLP